MAEIDDPRLQQLKLERSRLADDAFPEALKLLEKEIDRIETGFETDKFIDLHQFPAKVEFRVRLPIKEYPQANFVGRLVGPSGATIKELQSTTGCKVAVFGRGSIKDKAKEEELRRQGGKYAHLNHDLHVHIFATGNTVSCYKRIAMAMELIEPYLSPEFREDSQPAHAQAPGHPFGAPPRGRGMPVRGGRGGPAGWPAPVRNSAPPGVPRGRGQGARGAAGGRGGQRGRGAPSGGQRGTPRGRGTPGRGQGRGAPRMTSPAIPSADYSSGDAYEYEATPTYMDPNAYGSAEAGEAYYDYSQVEGHAYDAYGGAWGEESADDSSYGKVASGRTPSNYRAHPY